MVKMKRVKFSILFTLCLLVMLFSNSTSYYHVSGAIAPKERITMAFSTGTNPYNYEYTWSNKGSPTIVLNTGSNYQATGYGNQRKICPLGNLIGTVYIVTRDGTQIYLYKSTDYGESFSQDEHISTYAGMDSYTQNYPSITRDSNDDIHIVWVGKATGYTTDDQVWYRGQTGGVWGSVQRISNATNQNTERQFYPSLFCDLNDYVHIVWYGGGNAYHDWNPEVWYTNNSKGDWITPEMFPTSGGTNYFPSGEIDSSNNLHFTWSGSSGGANRDIYYRNRTSSGWSTPQVISDGGGRNNQVQDLPSMAIGYDDDIHIVWDGIGNGFGDNTIWYLEKDNTTGAWSTAISLSKNLNVTGNRWAVVGTDNNSNPHVVFQHNTTTPTGYVYYTYYGSSWSTEKLIRSNAYRPTISSLIAYRPLYPLDYGHTSIIPNTECTFYSQWKSDVGTLQDYIVGHNASGVFTNSTQKSFSGGDWANDTTILPSGNGTVIQYDIWASDSLGQWDSIGLQSFEMVYPAEYLNTTFVSGLEGEYQTVGVGAEKEWIFVGEKYYFVSYAINPTTFKLSFNDGYDMHKINFKWDNTTLSLSTDNDENDDFVTGLFYSDVEITGVTYKLTWGWIPDKNIVDDYNVTVSWNFYNSVVGVSTNGSTGITFRIYNLGGFGLTYQSGLAGSMGKEEGVDQFEIWNDGCFYSGHSANINSTGIWRRLQHIHTTFGFYRERAYVGGYYVNILSDDDRIYFGIDYYENGTWINVLEVRITAEDNGLVGRGGANADSSYEPYNITWYQNNTLIKQDIITVYNHGYSFYGDEPNNRTFVRFWLDLWFNKLNSSTVVGGRIAPYYNGMWEWNANPFWFGYGNFAPFFYNNSELVSMCFTTLKNATGHVRSCYGLEIERFYAGINKHDDFLRYLWKLQDYTIFNTKLADDRMEGIDTPVFVEPEDISMPKGGGFLQPVVDAINGISTMITKSVFGLIKLLMGAMGSFMNMIGLGEWWDYFSIVISNIATASIAFMDEFQTALVNSALLLTQVYKLLGVGIGRFLYFISNSITGLLLWYGYIVDMFTGGGSFITNIWNTLSMGDFLILGLHLLPVWWLNRLGKADNLIDTLKSDVMFMTWLVTGLFNFFVTIIMLSVALLNLLIGLLPI